MAFVSHSVVGGCNVSHGAPVGTLPPSAGDRTLSAVATFGSVTLFCGPRLTATAALIMEAVFWLFDKQD